MKMFCYCPVCKREELVCDADALAHYRLRETVLNPCGGRGEIRHFVCECGNPLAGMIDVSALCGDDFAAQKKCIWEYSRHGVHFDVVLYDRARAAHEAKKKLGLLD